MKTAVFYKVMHKPMRLIFIEPRWRSLVVKMVRALTT